MTKVWFHVGCKGKNKSESRMLVREGSDDPLEIGLSREGRGTCFAAGMQRSHKLAVSVRSWGRWEDLKDGGVGGLERALLQSTTPDHRGSPFA